MIAAKSKPVCLVARKSPPPELVTGGSKQAFQAARSALAALADYAD
jgi:hypothetical protein